MVMGTSVVWQCYHFITTQIIPYEDNGGDCSNIFWTKTFYDWHGLQKHKFLPLKKKNNINSNSNLIQKNQILFACNFFLYFSLFLLIKRNALCTNVKLTRKVTKNFLKKRRRKVTKIKVTNAMRTTAFIHIQFLFANCIFFFNQDKGN